MCRWARPLRVMYGYFGGGGGGGLNAFEFGKFSEQTVNISSEDWPLMCVNVCVLKTKAVAVHIGARYAGRQRAQGSSLKCQDAVTRRPDGPGRRGQAWP